MMFRSMHVDRRKVHDLFQKQQGILLCAASEGYDHRYISTIAVTGITDKMAIFTDSMCQLLFVADAAGFHRTFDAICDRCSTDQAA